ncbi:MAG TPA: DNA-binding protein [Candidatus Angelobacter sp.]|nr:DNA-binding protein [Candidatus Angelobacter sp.]
MNKTQSGIPSPASPSPASPYGFPPFMRTEELAERLHLRAKTLAQYRVTGEGPTYIRAGPRCILYEAKAVEDWLAKGRRNSTSAAA